MGERGHKVLRVKEPGRCIGCYSCMLACARTVRRDFSPAKSAIKIMTSGGYQGSMAINICRGCQNPPCALSCPEGALVNREGGGVILKKDKCTGCFKCLSACPIGAIGVDKEAKVPIICIHCGNCVSFCPHHILYMEEVSHDIK